MENSDNMLGASFPFWLWVFTDTRMSLQESLTCICVCRAWKEHILEMLKTCTLRNMYGKDPAICNFLPDLAVLRRLSAPSDKCITAAFEACIEQAAACVKDSICGTEKRCKILEALGRFADKDDQVVTSALCVCLVDNDYKLRQSAAEALGCLVEKNAQYVVAALCARLEDIAPDVRSSSIKALGRLAENDPGAMAAICMRLKHPAPFVRCAAILALVPIAKAGDEDVFITLRSCLNDANVFVKRQAALGLANLADKNSKYARSAPARPGGQPLDE
eukprot:CAMPEP_0172810354 /NCGR_PEP_ID=MMETSP1075-20121228/8744_1 /TAXON_ID=2916 /ORGANISM="Ceratium fusus, Strain PA161109" /LENGTH=275 /DNA_ID=CAMNT_0013649645 /DNA_START=44 /DNA_END=871 /DNA_ORIENTATION=+